MQSLSKIKKKNIPATIYHVPNININKKMQKISTLKFHQSSNMGINNSVGRET